MHTPIGYMEELIKNEQKLEKSIVNRIHKVRGQLQSLTLKDNASEFTELTMELQACIGALNSIKRLFVVEQGKLALDALQAKKFKEAEDHLTELIKVVSRKSTEV